MTGFFLSLSVLLALACLGFGLWLRHRMRSLVSIPRGRVAYLFVAGAAAAVVTSLVERWGLNFAGLSLQPDPSQRIGALLAMMLFAVPLEEACKVALIWPLYVSRRLVRGSSGATHAILGTAGFAAMETLLWGTLWGGGSPLELARAAIALPAQYFFAGLWGYMLGGARRDRYFGVVWLACVAVHGIYDHVVFSRGPAFLVVVVPMQALMVVGVWALLRTERSRAGRNSSSTLFDAASALSVREATGRRPHRLMLHWIVLGLFVTVGVTLSFLGLSVYLGHRFGIDFSLADEAGITGAIPIALLAAALLCAFPFSGYLIARASGASSVLEPAWATGAAILVVLLLFSVTEPTALVIALAVAPVGLLLACVGAWMGLERG